MKIVGVGQMFNFQTGAMEDRIQILSESGEQFSIPTTNDGANLLVQKAMGNGHSPLVEEEDHVDRVFQQGRVGKMPVGDLQSQIQERYADVEEDSYPDGAEVFGGPAPLPTSEAAAAKAAKTKQMLGVGRNASDRSGVPSHTITNVDEKGNPKLPPPDDGMDDEEDPGEVGSI